MRKKTVNSAQSKYEHIFEEKNVKSLRTLSAISVIVGSWALIFEIYFFQRFSISIYFARVLFTAISSVVFFLSYKSFQKKTINLLTHILIISLISSFAFTTYKIPRTIYINSQILSLLIFTIAIIFSWETKNQIIVAIYYNILFAASVMYNDENIYLLPNLFSLIIFVCLISSLSVVVSFVNFNLQKKYSIRSEEIDFLFNSVPVGICRTDMHGKILTCNKFFLNIFNFQSGQISDNILELINENNFQEFFLIVSKSQNNHELHTRLSSPQLEYPKFFKISAKKVANETYKKSLEFIFNDETNEVMSAMEKESASELLIKEIKEKEKIATEALLEKKRKIEMLAKINHEVRTPLNSILIFFEMIDEGLLKSIDEIRKYAKSVKTASQSLLHTVNNFIDYVKIETGKIEVEIELFNINDETESIISLLTPLATIKNNKLIAENKSSSKNLVYSDVSKYRQTLTNLIANAIKFTHNGTIKVSFENVMLSNEDYEISVSVEDTGLGIPEDKIGSIFDPFISLKDADKANYSSGLGLTICREFINMLNGKISVESKVGIGTKFIIKIPYTYSFPKNVQ